MNVCQVCKKNDPHVDLVSVSGYEIREENFTVHAHCALQELAYWERIVDRIKGALVSLRGIQ